MEQSITTTAAFKAAEVYEQFLVPGIYRYWTPLLLKRAAPQLGERVLDVASGTGVVARSIVPLVGNKGKVVGLDINPAMLAVACKQFSDHCDEIDWREGKAEDIPFGNHDFDLVTCQQGLQFFKNRPKASQEMRRVLQPKGRVAIAVWQSLERNSFYGTLFEALAAVFTIPITDVNIPFAFGDPGELERLLVGADFRQVKVESVRQDVHFNEVNRFVELTIKGVAAVLPAFVKMDGEMQSELQQKVNQEVAVFIKSHVTDGMLTFPMYANIATAVA